MLLAARVGQADADAGHLGRERGPVGRREVRGQVGAEGGGDRPGRDRGEVARRIDRDDGPRAVGGLVLERGRKGRDEEAERAGHEQGAGGWTPGDCTGERFQCAHRRFLFSRIVGAVRDLAGASVAPGPASSASRAGLSLGPARPSVGRKAMRAGGGECGVSNSVRETK